MVAVSAVLAVAGAVRAGWPAARGQRALRRLLRFGRWPLPAPLRAVAEALGVAGRVDVVATGEAFAVTYGLWRPRTLLSPGLAPKFDHTPFRTPESILGATAHALSELGPFSQGLDVCCGTGAGMLVLRPLCQGRITGVDFSAGMLAQARSAHPDVTWVRADARALAFAEDFDLAVTFGALGHFLPTERPALFEGVYRALRPGGLFTFPIGAPPPLTSLSHWATLGFDLAMRVRNAAWRPPFVMYYRTSPLPAVRDHLTAAGFTVRTVALAGLGRHRDGSPWCRLILARRPADPH